MWAIQIIESCKNPEEAQTILAALMLQVDFIAGRVLQPTYHETLRVQTIMEGTNEHPNGWLPDGCHHVLLIPNILEQMKAW